MMEPLDTQFSLEPQKMPSLAGSTIGRFMIGEQIGRGGMGEVYRAQDTKLRRTVAIKRIGAKFRTNPIYRSRLMKEAQLASSLNDAHITAVYDVFDNGDEYFLVMEFVEGQCLRRYISGSISEEDFVNIATQCIEGLAVAHSGGLVHRDIKPENIMITPEKQVKICDFGLARIALTQKGHEDATLTGSICGTPAYMAPEVHLGSVLDPRSDVFSLGMVLFELWTGKPAFDNEVFLQSRSTEPTAPEPAEVRSGLPRQFNIVIQRMLAFSPAGRYGDATAALEDLRALKVSPDKSIPLRARHVRSALLILASALVIAIVGRNAIRSPDSPPKDVPSVLLGEFENKSGNGYFDFTVSNLFAIGMEQSQYLNVMSRYRVSEALSQLGRPASERLTPAVALDIAKRERAKFVLSGEVKKQADLADRVEVSMRLIDTATGRDAKVIQATFGRAEELPEVIRKLTYETRTWLGESSTQINATNIHLDRATTRSAVAWERFARAIRMEALGNFEDEIALLKSAVEIDPDFAMAHAQLGIMQSSRGNLQEAQQSIDRAYELRDRVTEHERYTIVGAYHSLRYELELAVQNFRTLSNLYPYDDVGQRYYAQALSNVLQIPDAITVARKALALNSNSAINRGTLGLVLDLANRNDEVISLMKEVRAAGVVNPALQVAEGQAWLGKGEFRRAENTFNELTAASGSWQNEGRLQMAKVLVYEGRLKEAASQLEVDVAIDPQVRDTRLAVQRRNWLAWIRALQGQRTSAKEHVRALLEPAASPINVRELRGAGVILAEIGELDLARKVLERLESFAQLYQGNLFRSAVAQVRGEIQWAEHHEGAAREQLERAALLWSDALMLWSLAQFSEAVGDFERSQSLYHAIVSREGEIIRSHFPALKDLALAGAARCEVKLGNYQQASNDYDEFLSTMGMHSPELEFVKTARRARERLAALAKP